MAETAHDEHDPATRLAAIVAEPLHALGFALYDVEITGSGRGRTLRILVDRAQDAVGTGERPVAGIDLDGITAATEALAPVLDLDPVVAEVLPGSYLLEVSSPGLERRLRTPAHFRGALGACISLKAREADGTASRRRLVLVDADDEGIVVDDGGTRARVGYGDIVQARTVFEWGPAPKPGKGPRRPQGSKPEPTVSATS